MLKDFFLNGAILISAFAVFGNLLKDYHLNRKSSFKMKIFWGVMFGILGVILMLFSIQIDSFTIADLRHLATVFAAALGGMVPALISAFVIGLGRALFFGGNHTALVASLFMLAIGVSCGFLSRMKIPFKKKSFWMNIVSLLIISISLYINVDAKEKLPLIYAFHFSISLLGGYFSFQIIQYFMKSNEAFQKLKISEHNYRQLADQYKSVVNNVKEVIFQTNGKGEWIFLNPSWTEITGFTIEESIGDYYLNYVYPEDQEGCKNLYQSIPSEKEYYKHEIRIITKNGGFRWLEVYSRFSHNKQGILIGASGTLYDISKRKMLEQELKEASIIDSLTGIPNRRYFDEMILKEWKSCARNSKELSLIMLDIDYFKLYNDAYGHQVGDECLRKFAQTVKKVLMRPSDIVCRYGGEEFAVILPETSAEGAEVVARNIRLALEEVNIPHLTSKISSMVTTSAGIATVLPGPTNDYDDLFNRADKALYSAKNAGRNCMKHYEEKIEIRS